MLEMVNMTKNEIINATVTKKAVRKKQEPEHDRFDVTTSPSRHSFGSGTMLEEHWQKRCLITSRPIPQLAEHPDL